MTAEMFGVSASSSGAKSYPQSSIPAGALHDVHWLASVHVVPLLEHVAVHIFGLSSKRRKKSVYVVSPDVSVTATSVV